MTPEDSELIEIIIGPEHLECKRLDVVIAKSVPNISRSLIKKFYEKGHIVAEDSSLKIELKKLPPLGTKILFTIPPATPTENIPQDIPLEILFEDEYLVIINKPAGLVVHPAPGNPDGTLVNAILFHCPDLKGIGNEKRPGIVHRLDKGTSGVMVIAKEQKTHEGLVNLFSTHDIDRYYEAIILGTKLDDNLTIDAPIGRSPHNRLKMAADVTPSKKAITFVKVLDLYKSFSHVELKLETGRTHQIRVHLSQIQNTPILNDPLYGREKEEKLQMNSNLKNILKDYDYPLLHAKVLGFVHPITNEKLHFKTSPPAIFQEVLQALKYDK